MFITEAVTISEISLSLDYKYIRTIQFKDRLYKVVTASNELFDVGEKVLYIPDGAILPDYLLKRLGFWDYKYNHGTLKGVNQNVVAAYRHANDPHYQSSGLILKAKNGLISGFSCDYPVDMPDIDQKLGITYIKKRDMSYFKGDIFLFDIPVNKDYLPDIEHSHGKLLNMPVVYEELIRGRKFFLTMHRTKRHHHAMGENLNVYLTTDTLGPYRFLSNTKKNNSGNIFYSSVIDGRLCSKIEGIMVDNPKWEQFTIGFVLRAVAYTGRFPTGRYVNDNTIAVDMFVGKVPTGRFLNKKEFNSICNTYHLHTPEYYGEGIYSLDELNEYKKRNPHGIAIKSDDGKLGGAAYSDDVKLRFITTTT